jgi:hypothetical protein
VRFVDSERRALLALLADLPAIVAARKKRTRPGRHLRGEKSKADRLGGSIESVKVCGPPLGDRRRAHRFGFLLKRGTV